MCRAFAPVLAAAGGGAIVNMLSVTSFFTNPFDASYGASKTAEWSPTNGVRLELHHQGTLVVATPTRPMMPVTLGQFLAGLPEGGRSSQFRLRRSRDRLAPAWPDRRPRSGCASPRVSRPRGAG
jgi:NAD(P)-dependent dehydrogenase (short-subunit alcohol dehydrogenase family)